MEDESRPFALVSPLRQVPGIHDDEEPPSAPMAPPAFHPPPPLLPCRPVKDVPPPGVFLTAEACTAFCMLESLLGAHQAARPALPAVLPALAAAAAAYRENPRTQRRCTGGPAASLSDSDSEGVVSSHVHALPAVRGDVKAQAVQRKEPERGLVPFVAPAAASLVDHSPPLTPADALQAAPGAADRERAQGDEGETAALTAGVAAAAEAAAAEEEALVPMRQDEEEEGEERTGGEVEPLAPAEPESAREEGPPGQAAAGRLAVAGQLLEEGRTPIAEEGQAAAVEQVRAGATENRPRRARQQPAGAGSAGRQNRSAAKRRQAGAGAEAAAEASHVPAGSAAAAGTAAAEAAAAPAQRRQRVAAEPAVNAQALQPLCPEAAAAGVAVHAQGSHAEGAPEGGQMPALAQEAGEGDPAEMPQEEGGAQGTFVGDRFVGGEFVGDAEDEDVAEEEQAVARGRMNISEAAAAAVLRRMGKGSLQELLAEQVAKADQAGERGKGGKRRQRKGQLTDLLNPNSHLHHPQFAAAYKRAKEALGKRCIKKQQKEVLKEHSKLFTRWSALTAQDHQWFLEHRGKPLVGAEAERMQLLAEAVHQEQQQYYSVVQQAGQAHMERYSHCTPRQAGQIEADLQKRRERVLRMPRVFRLHSVLPIAAPAVPPAVPSGEGPAAPPQLTHISMLRRAGSMPACGALLAGTLLPGGLFYLPCTVEAHAVPGTAAPGQAEQQQAAGRKQWQQGRPYRKVPPPEVQDDSMLTQLLPAALKYAGAAAAAAAEPGTAAAGATAVGTAAEAAAGAGAVQGGALVCMAASAFACLAGTPMRGNAPAWELPITVAPVAAAHGAQQEVPDQGGPDSSSTGCGGEGQSQQLAAFVGKPLVPRHLSLRQKQARLHKYAVLSAALRSAARGDKAPPPAGTPPVGAGAAAGSPGADQSVAADPWAYGAPNVAPRHVSYDLWALGKLSLLVRTHDRALDDGGPQEPITGQSGEGEFQPHQQQQAQQQQAHQAQPQQTAAVVERGENGSSGSRLVIPVVKAEYLPPPDQEDHTAQELASWWCKASLRPGCDLLVTRASVPQSKVLSTERLAASDLQALGALNAGAALDFVHSVLVTLSTLPAGQFVLAHAPFEESLCLFRALGDGMLGEEAPALPPLPCSASVARAGALYDLHAAHARSGEADDQLESPFIPPRWRPFDPAVPQIPYTFPPRMSLGKLGVALPRKRQRDQLPYAWSILGKGGDFDQVGHVGKISRQEYAQSLEEELA